MAPAGAAVVTARDRARDREALAHIIDTSTEPGFVALAVDAAAVLDDPDRRLPTWRRVAAVVEARILADIAPHPTCSHHHGCHAPAAGQLVSGTTGDRWPFCVGHLDALDRLAAPGYSVKRWKAAPMV